MEWFIAAVAVVALGVAAVVAAGGGGSMAREPVRDTFDATLPDGRFDGDAVRQLRFGVALRGYAMDQVDAVLDRLAGDLEARDVRIAQLEAQLGAPGGVATEATGGPLESAPATWEQPR
ncbi:DivIVA domain-containing protein [Microlunatus antarcticus]|uniref:DivIVA domain-containing protein n=1 Tax=Microlunatus antarcticus TaxID=53388 RepID=A0A7W5P8H4_9ACTN|nr:DivIVA domain-containing protein [Microlunatus antarcticus]MBB3328492.1 DivIVA domain-containing protein [Microlunatus antarcticus]